MPGQTLEQKISAAKELGLPFPQVPNIIKNNLNPLFQLRPYQIESFSRFIFYMNNPQIRQKPTQLLFHMATGSGKTLIMAGAILCLYEQGYRNFIFFVNSTDIINKTRDNFLNPLSIKYLFSENITYGDKQVSIKEVDNFQVADQEDINIVFSTIQGLHSHLNTPRENSITYDDFTDKKLVLLSDDGRPLEPDFVLFLEKKETEQSLYYQVFIEPKGEHLLKEDEWKENFLRSLKEKVEIKVLWKTKKFIVWGMPFYNEQLRKVEFEDEFKKIIND